MAVLAPLKTIGFVAGWLLAVAAVVAISSSHHSTNPDYIAVRDRTQDYVTSLFGMSPRKGCMHTPVDKTVQSIVRTPWKAGFFNVTYDQYAAGVMAGSYGACPIPVKGMGAEDSETISMGHYWWANDQKDLNMKHQVRDSYFIQYYSAAYNAFRYDEIFVYNAAFDKTMPGVEMFECGMSANGMFGNVNIAPGVNPDNTSDLSSKYGGTVAGTSSACVAAPMIMNSGADPTNPQVATYLGAVKFPQGFFLVGEVFDAYQVKDRWPIPGAVLIYYVDRTPESRNYGYVTAWLVFQGGATAGKNYFWDMSNVRYSGAEARRMFEEDPYYYFKFPKPMVDGCPATWMPMTNTWKQDPWGEPAWINGTVRATRKGWNSK